MGVPMSLGTAGADRWLLQDSSNLQEQVPHGLVTSVEEEETRLTSA